MAIDILIPKQMDRAQIHVVKKNVNSKELIWKFLNVLKIFMGVPVMLVSVSIHYKKLAVLME